MWQVCASTISRRDVTSWRCLRIPPVITGNVTLEMFPAAETVQQHLLASTVQRGFVRAVWCSDCDAGSSWYVIASWTQRAQLVHRVISSCWAICPTSTSGSTIGNRTNSMSLAVSGDLAARSCWIHVTAASQKTSSGVWGTSSWLRRETTSPTHSSRKAVVRVTYEPPKWTRHKVYLGRFRLLPRGDSWGSEKHASLENTLVRFKPDIKNDNKFCCQFMTTVHVLWLT